MAEALQPPPPISGPPAPSDRQSRLESLIKSQALPDDQAKQVRQTFATPNFDTDKLQSFIGSLPVDQQTKHALWDTYYQYEPPQPKPTPAPIKPVSTMDVLKQFPSALSSVVKEQVGKYRQEKAAENAPPPTPMDATRQTVVPNTTASLADLTKPELRMPAPVPPPQPLNIAGTYGNALVLSDGSLTTQTPKNLKVYHDSGYPELTADDLQKVQRGESLQAKGMAVPGTIKNLYNRPVLKNADGSVSTTRSMSFDEDGKEVLVPTVVDGKQLSNSEAISHYKATGEHLGKFDSPEEADTYAVNLHNSQAQRMGLPPDSIAAPFRSLDTESPEDLATRVGQQEQAGIKNLGGLQPTEPAPWTEIAKDMFRRTVRGAATAASSATLGILQPTSGDIHIPVLDRNFHIIPGAEDRLRQLGMAAPADKWQGATNTISSLLAMSAPWASISRALQPLYGTAETGLAANLMSRLESTLGTSFVVGAIEPKEDDQTRLEHIANTMGGAVVFHTLAETAAGIGTVAKIKAVSQLKNEVAEVLYGRRPDTFDQASAKKMASDLVDQSIDEQGGIENVSRQSIQDRAARAKASPRGPLPFVGPEGRVGSPVGGPGIPTPETGGPSAPPEPGTVEGQGFTMKPGAPAEPEPPLPEGAPKPGEPPAAGIVQGGKTVGTIPAEESPAGDRSLISPDAIPENKKLPHGMEIPDGDMNHGSSSVGLSDEGREGAQKLAKLVDVPKLYTSDLPRATETAQIIASAHPGMQVIPSPALQPWALGGLEGQKMKDVLPRVNALAQDMPDAIPDGRGPISTRGGQSFNQWKSQVIPFFRNVMDEFRADPTQSIGVLTHSRDIQLLHLDLEHGMPDDLSKLDSSKFLRGHGDTASIEYLTLGDDGKWTLDDKKPDGPSIQLIRHAHEEQANKPSEVTTALAPVAGPASESLPPVPTSGTAVTKAVEPEVIPPSDAREELGDRWHWDRDLGQEAVAFLDGADEETAKAAITNDGRGDKGPFHVELRDPTSVVLTAGDGQKLGPFDNIKEAAAAAEKAVPQINVTRPTVSAPIAKPIKTFTHDGKNVVGIYKGQVVLEDGTLTSDFVPDYLKVMRSFGYKDLTDEQASALGVKDETKTAKPETKAQIPETIPPPAETTPVKSETPAPVEGPKPETPAPTPEKGLQEGYRFKIGDKVTFLTAAGRQEITGTVDALGKRGEYSVRYKQGSRNALSTLTDAQLNPQLPPKARDIEARLANYFRPGRVLPRERGDRSQDTVVAFTPSTPQKGWSVQISRLEDGEAKPHMVVHFTQPSPGELWKWERDNPPEAPKAQPKAATPPPPIGGPNLPPPPEPEAPKQEQSPPKSGFGKKNKFFTEDAAEEARQRLRDKFKNQFNVGFDPEMLSDMFKLGGYYFEAGAREFAAWAEQMVGDIGEGVRPYLQSQFDLISQWFKDHPEALEGDDNAGESTGSIEGHGPDEHPRERNEPGVPGGGAGDGLRGPQSGSATGGANGTGEPDQRPDEGNPDGKPAEQPTSDATKRKRAERSAAERFSLIGKDPVELTPSQRRDINARARELAESKNLGDPLTPEEQDLLRQYTGQGGLQTADEGVLFQHYTSYRTVQWQWNKLAAMGYPMEGASMLEPAAAIGNYAGFAPAGVKITMVEIDPIAAKIAALLYPQAIVQNKPFENFISKQLYDIVMTNVPFHASRGALQYAKDAEDYKNIDTLHDFFFAKGLDLAKPNGIVSFLTSTGTMDKLSPEIRKLLNMKGEFLGAYRTPAGEFQKNTQYGGSVDAIFFRKRTPEEIEAIKLLDTGTGGAMSSIGLDGEGSGEWLTSTDTDKFSKPDQPPAHLNTYYQKHPEQMWGKPEAGYGVRQVTRIGVRPTRPIDEFMKESLGDHIKWEPRETQASVKGYQETETAVGKAPEGTRHGTLIYDPKSKQLNYASGDGNLYPAFPKGLPDKTMSRVVQAVRMMDLTDQLYDALRKNDIKTADKIRPQLRQAIQNYRTQFGDKKGKFAPPPGYDNYLWRFLGGGTESMPLNFSDPRIWALSGLTKENGEFNPIFTTNTIWKPEIQPRQYDAKDIEDVAKFVYEQTGQFDREQVEQRFKGKGDLDDLLVGRPGFSISALAADGKPTIAMNEEYLFGPIWPKIDETQSMIQQVQANPEKFAAGVLPALDHQMSELTSVLPEQATVKTLPVDPFGSYVDHGTVMHWLKSVGMNAEMEYVPENNRHMWKVGGGSMTRNIIINGKTGERGDHRYDPEHVEAFLNHGRAMIPVFTGEYDHNGRPKMKKVFDIEGQIKQDQIVDSFKEWFNGNHDRVEHLVPVYNRMYRSFRHQTFAGTEANIVGLAANFKGAPLVIHKHQWEATQQLLNTRSGINAHGVGAGKTSQAITMLALAKQRGMINKPMLIVPAKVAGNWGYEIAQLFPTATVLNLSEMNSKNRNRMLHQAAMSQPDYIIATYEGMKEVPLRASADYMEEDIREYEDRLRALKEKKAGDKRIETMIQDQIRKMRNKLAAINDMKKTNAIFFEDTGIDSLVWDEMHALKNAPVQYMDMSEWLHAASYSQRAADAIYKTRYIHERRNGRKGQNVWGLTATPTPNNPIEIYSMMKYIAPDEWKDRGINDAGQFVNNFGIVGQVEEVGTTGVPKVRTVFSGYKNMNDLRPIFRRYIDMRPTSAFDLKRPKAQYVEHVMNPSPEVSFEAARVADIDDWITRSYKDAAANGWIPINLLTLARKLAADLAVYNPLKYKGLLGREGSKLHEIIQQVKASDQGDNTQLIFMDLYRATAKVPVGSQDEKLIQMFLDDGNADHIKAVDINDDSDDLGLDESTDDEEKKPDADPGTTAIQPAAPVDPNAKVKMKTYELVNIHKELKKALMAIGIPEDQIAIINQGSNNGPKKKFKVQQLNAEGKIRFLIGTTASMGEGMNLQANTTDIHHYDVPWTPAALEQREGRGVRQGNKQALVRVHRYVGKGTSDAKMYAVLARKAQWLEQLWYGDANEVMDFDQDHRNYADIAADAQIDTSTLEYWQTSRRIKTNTGKLKDLETDDLTEARRMLSKVDDEISERTAKIQEYEQAIRSGRGSDYTVRLVEQHKEQIDKLTQEKLTRTAAVEQTERSIAELRAAIAADGEKLKNLIPEMKSKGMPVSADDEKLAESALAPQAPSPVKGPNDLPDVPGASTGTPQVPAAAGTKYMIPNFAGGRQAPPVAMKPPLTIDGKTYSPVTIQAAVPDGGREAVVGWQIAPGVAVQEALKDKPKRGQKPEPTTYTVTHMPSGLVIARAPTLEDAVFKANRIAPLGDWTRSADDMQADRPFMNAVNQKLKGEAGALNFWRKKQPSPIQANLIPSPDPEMRKLVELPGQQRNIWAEIRAIPGQAYRFMTSARYNEDLKQWPAFAERVRRAQELVRDASAKAMQRMEAVVKGLHPAEYDVFRSLVFWEDMYETAAREGEHRVPLAGANQLQRIEAEVQRLQGIATPETMGAVDRFHSWMEDEWSEFVRRGKADPNEGRIKYFPNQIIRSIGDAIDRLPGLPVRMQNPRRLYLTNRKGHTAPHDADWIHVMEQYGTRVNLHNMVDDFIENTADENDFRQWLSDTQMQQLTGSPTGTLKVGRTYMLDTQTLTPQQRQKVLEATRGGPGFTGDLPAQVALKGFQFNPGNVIYPVRAINDDVIWDAVNAGMDELTADLDKFRAAMSLPGVPQLETDMGDPLTRPALALGGKHTIHLLPAEISNKLEHFRESNIQNPLTELIRAATQAWKGAVINSSGLAYYFHITVGNEITAWMEDIGSLVKQPAALAALRSKMPPPHYQQLMQLAEDFRVWNSVFYTGSMPRAINAPAFRDFRKPTLRGRLNPFGDNPIGDVLREWQRYGQIVQSFPKIAKLMADLERVQNGQPVVTKGVDLGGLDPRSDFALGKVAREAVHPDYGAVSPRMQLFYSTVFPFTPFHVKIVGPWLRRMKYQAKAFPGDEFLLKIVLGVFVSAFLWNHLLYPDVEAKLEDWQKEIRHINTPLKDENGKPMIIAMETPLDIVARWGGLHTLETNIDKVLKNEFTWEEAAKQQLQDMFGRQPHGGPVPTAPASVLYQMLNPMAKVLWDLHANKDSFTGQEIVSKSDPNLWGDTSKDFPQTARGLEIQKEYVAKKMIAPYMQMMRAVQMDTPDTPIWNWLTENGPFGWKRALGVRTVNPNGADMKDWYSSRNWNQALYDEKMSRVADAYVEWESGNITPDERDAQIAPLLEQPGPNPTFASGATAAEQSDVQRMREKPAYQIRVAEEVLHHTTDPTERQRLIERVSVLQNQVHRDSYKATPERIRPFVGLPPVPNP